ncbi:MAG: patatin-like phospholipase family protein [Proteobacteria bacterium]|nr:patatin-like phospholipase family protein [Pseudomonadota bacterium]
MTYKILAVDGGGIRGIIPATITEFIERETGRSASQLFDMFIGTSTGAILTAGLVTPTERGGRVVRRYGAREIMRIYRNLGSQVFQDADLATVLEPLEKPNPLKAKKMIESIQRLHEPLHSVRNLERLLGEQYGDITMKDVLKRLLLTTYDLQSRSPLVFDSAEHKNRKVAKVVAASAAAPAFFAPVRMPRAGGQRYLLTDGGVCLSNPALHACIVAMSEGVRKEDMVVVSIGTGHAQSPGVGDDIENWGPWQWMLRMGLLDVMFDAMADAADQQLALLLGANYHRLQVALPPEDVHLDDGSAAYVDRLHNYTQAFINDDLSGGGRLRRVIEAVRS